MKITANSSSVPSSVEAGHGRPMAQPARPAAASTDKVELSSLSARLQKAGVNLAETPAIDSARVAELKQAIAEGRFQIHPERITNGLLDDVRQLLASQG